MKSFVVPGPNAKYLYENFPGGEIKQVGKNSGWQSIYKFKSVINSPTPAEIRFFKATKFARLIPQHPGGFDVRDSGIARSIKSSVAARHDHKITIAKRKFAMEEAKRKAEMKVSKPKPIPRPVIKKVQIPEPETITRPILPSSTKTEPVMAVPLPKLEPDDDSELMKEHESEEIPETDKSFHTQKKPGRRKKKRQSDSSPKDIPDDESTVEASDEAGQKNNGGQNQ